jgi:predicted nucleic acid-binding protein
LPVNPLDELYISSVTLAELRFGIQLLSEGSARRDELNNWLTRTIRPMFEQRVLPVTEDILFTWRVLLEEGRKTGHTFSQPDLIIAATALHHGLTVVTRDRSDFDKAGVPASNPWEQ